MKRLRVVLADDHAVVRRGLRSLLDTLGVDVVGEAAGGREAVRCVMALRPDLVLMDVQMHDGGGIAATREISSRAPETAVLILTMFEDDQLVLDALRAGARGYLLKSAEEDHLVQALAAVRNGDLVIGAKLAGRLVGRLGPEPEAVAPEPFPHLTAGERDVLALVAEGLTNAAIARRLRLSPNTVRNRLSSVFSKLGVQSRTQAALLAEQHGPGRPNPRA